MDTHIPGASAPMQAAQPAIFQFHSVEVRTINRDGQVWFVAGDVAKALGYADAVQMTRVLDEDEAALHNMQIRSENGTIQTREVTILSESGLYHALLKSRKPEAKPFRKWVTTEVLPSIRRNGSFSSAGAQIPAELQKSRFLLTVYPDGRSDVITLPHDAAILSPTSKVSMSTLMREFVPVKLLPELMHIGLERIAKLAGAKS
jgi:prophage antirepressor-like protein